MNINYYEYILLTFALIFLFIFYKQNKQLEKSKHKFKKLFENNPLGLIQVDVNGKIIEANEAMVNLVGAPNKETLKKININTIIKLKEIWDNEFLSSNNKENFSGVIKHTTRWYKNVVLEYKVATILNRNRNTEFIVAFSDISKETKIKEELKFLSFHDKLTGLYNRRYFENEMERLDHSRVRPISIIVGDLNGLKRTNDNHGHKMGDLYIKKIAEVFKNSLRKEDIAARMGGDEFAVLLTNSTKKTAQKVCRRILKECRIINQKNNFPEPLSISLGYSTIESKNESLEKCYEKADKNMFENKNIRKNLEHQGL